MARHYGTAIVFHRGKRAGSHRRSLRPHRPSTVPERMPSVHRRYRDWTRERIMRPKRSVPMPAALINVTLRSRPGKCAELWFVDSFVDGPGTSYHNMLILRYDVYNNGGHPSARMSNISTTYMLLSSSCHTYRHPWTPVSGE
jgi:hypothetical protein